MSTVIHVNDENFREEVLEADKPVLVDFWADWCGPCRMVEPVVSALSEEYKGKLIVCKASTDEVPQKTGEYGISQIPTLMVFHKGQVIHQKVGVLPKGEIVKLFEDLL